MATIETHPVIHEETTDARERHVRTKRTLGGVGIETFAAVGALVLAIIALAGLYADQLGGIAAIAIGLALLFEGLSVGTELTPDLEVRELTSDAKTAAEVGVEAFAGIGVVVLGILSLAGVASAASVLPAAAIVAGVGVLFVTQPLLVSGSTSERNVVHETVRGAAGAHAFAGVGAIVLGIIAYAVTASITLALVAFLALGASLVLGSAAIGGRLASSLRA